MPEKSFITAEDSVTIEKLVADGVPTRWIAETINVTIDTLKNHLKGRADARQNAANYNAVWTSIRPNDTLRKWHHLFAPKTVSR